MYLIFLPESISIFFAKFQFMYIVAAVLIIVMATFANYIFRKYLNNFLERAVALIGIKTTEYVFMKNTASFGIYIAALILIFYIIPDLRALAVTLFAGAGIFAAVIALASQQAFSNIVSGVFIVIFKPFGVGEQIKIGLEVFGTVEDITLRHTIIRNVENKRFIIPNSIIGNQIIVNSHAVDIKTVALIPITVSPDTNLNKAIEIILQECLKHPKHIDNRTEEQKSAGDSTVTVRILDFLPSGILIRAQLWTANPDDAFALKCDLNKILKERFEEEGIEISYSYQKIEIKK